jgi:hypothetical protein
MNRETATTASTVVIVLDGDTDAGWRAAFWQPGGGSPSWLDIPPTWSG